MTGALLVMILFFLDALDLSQAERTLLSGLTPGKQLEWLASRFVLDHITDRAFVPIAVGGKIETTEEARSLFRLGADKVVLGHQSPFYEQLSKSLGAQSVVAGIESGHGYDVVQKARELEDRRKGFAK